MEGQRYALFYTILYKELEHLLILVSTEILEPIFFGYQGLTIVKFSGSQKIEPNFLFFLIVVQV